MSSESLLELAKSRAPADRERLLLGIVELCDAGDGAATMGSPQIQALLNSIFLGLVAGAERDIRKRLAEKLSTVEWAPPALINVLALDEIEIARPVIASSPLLKEADLIRLLVEATIEHQIEVARRPNLGAAVVAAILRAAQPAVMTALAGNRSAERPSLIGHAFGDLDRRVLDWNAKLFDAGVGCRCESGVERGRCSAYDRAKVDSLDGCSASSRGECDNGGAGRRYRDE